MIRMKLDSFKIVPRGILIKRVLKKARVATVSKARKDGWWWKNKSKRSNKTSVCSYQVSVVDSWRERESELARIVVLVVVVVVCEAFFFCCVAWMFTRSHRVTG